jgi:membrane-bound lytic murein transglycosylase B
MIRNSVGRKGVNKKTDVQLVQEALNRSIIRPRELLKVDGIAGLLTIGAIERFQKDIVGFLKPDGLIEVDGKTWRRLFRYLIDPPASKSHGIQQDSETKGTPHITHQDQSRKIAWGKKVAGAFKNKIIQIGAQLEVSPDYLMACIAFETGATFSPSIKNAAGSGAVGLIQFMPKNG